MKKTRLVFSILVFLCALVYGYRWGFNSYSRYARSAHENSDGVYPGPLQTQIRTNGAGFRVVLVILADDFYKDQPTLHGIWLLTYSPSEPQVVFFPIFPHFEGEGGEQDWQAIFQVEAERGPGGFARPSDELKSALMAQNYWWSGFMLLDEFGIEELALRIEAGTPSAIKSSFLPRDNPLIDLFNPLDPRVARALATRPASHEAALQAQVQLYQNICWFGSGPKGGEGLGAFDQIFSDYPEHAQTDLDSSQLVDELKQMRAQNGALLCDFPTISDYIVSHR